MTPLFVLTVESSTGCEVLGVFFNEKSAKTAANEYTSSSGLSFKKKLAKKTPEQTEQTEQTVQTEHVSESKRLLFLENSKDDSKKSVYLNFVQSELPASLTSGKSKKKDPNAPKKGMSAFMIFSNENRNKIKTQNPEVTFAEIGRKLGAAWKALTDKQKQVYTKKSLEDKKRYELEMEKYSVSTSTVQATV